MPHLNKTAWGQKVSSVGGKKYAQGRRGEERRGEGRKGEMLKIYRCLEDDVC